MSINPETASKRELIDWLQENTPEEFQTEHNLAGNAVSKAKNAKLTKLQELYALASGGGAKPEAGSETGVQTLAQAVRALTLANPEIGTKKLVAEVKLQYPTLEASGIKVGSKEVRQAVAALAAESSSGGDESSADGIGVLLNGMTMTMQKATHIFGVQYVNVKGRLNLEAGNKQYRLISANWRKQISPEGPCRQMVLQSKANFEEAWCFDLPCQGTNVVADPFAGAAIGLALRNLASK